MQDVEFNWLAVVVAAAVPMALGALWYSPLLFARPWMAAVGRTMEELTDARLGYFISAVGAVITSLVLSALVDWAEADKLFEGVLVGLIAWVGFVATTSAVNTYFGGRPRALWLIDNGYHVISLAVMGAILALWD